MGNNMKATHRSTWFSPMRGIATTNSALPTRALMEGNIFTKQLVSGTRYLGVMRTSLLALLAASLRTVWKTKEVNKQVNNDVTAS